MPDGCGLWKSYLVQAIWWRQGRHLMSWGGGRGRGGGLGFLEWHRSHSQALPLWAGWGRATEINARIHLGEWQPKPVGQLHNNLQTKGDEGERLYLTSLLSSKRTASCVSLLCSWLMCLMGLVRASAYSENTQRRQSALVSSTPQVSYVLDKLQSCLKSQDFKQAPLKSQSCLG